MKANLNDVGVIPFGWDYTCDKDKDGCKGMFRSFNDEKSYDITGPLLSGLDSENFMNSALSIKG